MEEKENIQKERDKIFYSLVSGLKLSQEKRQTIASTESPVPIKKKKIDIDNLLSKEVKEEISVVVGAKFLAGYIFNIDGELKEELLEVLKKYYGNDDATGKLSAAIDCVSIFFFKLLNCLQATIRQQEKRSNTARSLGNLLQEHRAQYNRVPTPSEVVKMLEKYLKISHLSKANQAFVAWGKNVIQKKIFKKTPPTFDFLLSMAMSENNSSSLSNSGERIPPNDSVVENLHQSPQSAQVINLSEDQESSDNE
jgi:hypothetical protein